MLRTVSILMPTYAPDATFLRAAIGSVLHQSWPHWTLAIRDDASTQDVEAIVKPYLKDSRISFVRNEQQLGIGGNWNATLQQAKGEFVQFLFQDDLWYRQYLEECLGIFERESTVGIVTAGHAYKTDESEESNAFLESGPFRSAERLRTEAGEKTHEGKEFLLKWLNAGLHPNIIGEPSFVMLRRVICERLGEFREDMHQGLDLEYWTRALQIADVHFIREELGIFRIHSQSASMRHDQAGQGLFDRIRILEILFSESSFAEIRHAAGAALVSRCREMMKKFRRRVRGGKRVRGSETRHILAIFLRHPLLLLRTMRSSFRPQEASEN
jgi:glycosyltransferase involved in cell wall biosynthesis